MRDGGRDLEGDFRRARVELNELRGWDVVGEDGGVRSDSSSGVVTIMVMGASGSLINIVSTLDIFFRRSVRAAWTRPEST